MTNEQLNRRLQYEQAHRLGTLYEDLCDCLYGSGDPSMNRSEIYKLCRMYGAENVQWMMEVLQEDMGLQNGF